MQSDTEIAGAVSLQHPTDDKTASSSTSAEPKPANETRNSGLKKCFSALVDRKQVNLELEVLRLMLRKELNINFSALEPDLADILPYALVHYIKTWPGWNRSAEYYSGLITFKSWFDKFSNFITLKLNETINVHYKEVIAHQKKIDKYDVVKKYITEQLKDKGIQTDNVSKVTAPFTIHVTAKPSVLNTLVFTHNGEGDIILKQHGVLEWDQKLLDAITLKQLISWPHVGVHLSSPIFSFSRINEHEFIRHISLVGTPLPSVETTEELVIVDPKITRHAYSIAYLKEMTTAYMEALKHVYPSSVILDAFQTVIGELLLDIEELNISINGTPTVANNTSVLYNIGKRSYFRNKKLARNVPNKHDIAYTEVIIPKIKFTITDLAGGEQIDEYFLHLKNFKPESNRTNGIYALPQMTFSCSYCEQHFSNGSEVTTHLKDEHKMEQHMLCVQCKRQLTAFELSKERWTHTCKPTTK